ncbi:hypothetical protein B0H19DRAFT_1252905 [Mycena capillaripes]|nr:hypothetical protein B0H19DRAFT_1252905 [Mycena capillaripes]
MPRPPNDHLEAVSMLAVSEKPFSTGSSASAVRKRANFVWGVLLMILLFLSARLEMARSLCGIGYPPRLLPLAPTPTVNCNTEFCPQVDPLFPTRNADIWETIRAQTVSGDFKTHAVDLLAGAVQIPWVVSFLVVFTSHWDFLVYSTESYDDMQSVGVDPRWDIFGEFHAYLARAFPLVHASLKLEKINTYGHFPCSSRHTKMSSPWIHWQWGIGIIPRILGILTGRGSADDKNGLIGILTSIETLLKTGFAPTRTFVAVFGFDEEASGLEGAGELAKVLLSTYGEDAFAFISDEGPGMINTFGTVAAFPGVAEKGYLDVVVDVTSPGGHSSAPPDHTTIGILAALLVQYEDNPYSVHLSRESTSYRTFQCLAEYSAAMPPAVKQIIVDSAQSDEALHILEGILSKDKQYRSQISTTQAIDVINGGVKVNALPEQADAIVNHRIATESSVAAVKGHNSALLQPLAQRFNLTFDAFDDQVSEPGATASGNLRLTDMSALEPAPVTPTSGDNSAPYQLLSGSIRATYNTRRAANCENSTVVVTPAMMSGNTDTRYYWKLSPHIFQYGHGNSAGAGLEDSLDGIHTVNESIDAEDFVEIIRFFLTLILNADESTMLISRALGSGGGITL